MAATVEIHVYTAGPVDEGAKTGIAFLSIDSGDFDLGTRQANKIVAGTRSYEKWIKAVVGATPPANWLNDFHIWGDGAVMANTTLFIGFTAAWANPTNDTSDVAVGDFTAYVVGAKGNWHTAGGGDANLVNPGDATKYCVLQLAVGAGHPGGSWTQEAIFYDYTEA